MTTVGDIALAHKLVVCVGTGGVGKTTVSAAIALGAAQRGRRVMVLTIDPARALARAMGLEALAPGGQPVEVAANGALEAGMFDQKAAWDGFVERHSPTPAIARQILDNSFYRELSTSFSGSTEYMAIEEVGRLLESGRYDLVVLDTPPAAHALDFLRAPERIDRLLDRDVARWLAGPYQLGHGAWRGAGALARFVVRRVERAAGASAVRDIAAFFVAIDALLDDAIARTHRARALLASGDAALVLVAGPRRLVLEETGALAARMRALATPLAAVVVNRAHLLSVEPATAALELTALDDPAIDRAAAAWLLAAWDDAVARSAAERAVVSRFAASLPPEIAVAVVPEAPHDVHALSDLRAIADVLWAQVLRPPAGL